jgi:hypothetical protein
MMELDRSMTLPILVGQTRQCQHRSMLVASQESLWKRWLQDEKTSERTTWMHQLERLRAHQHRAIRAVKFWKCEMK